MSVLQPHLDKVERVLDEAEGFLLDGLLSRMAIDTVDRLRRHAGQCQSDGNEATMLPSFITSCTNAINGLKRCASHDYVQAECQEISQSYSAALQRIKQRFQTDTANKSLPATYRNKLTAFYENLVLNHSVTAEDYPYSESEEMPSVMTSQGKNRIDRRLEIYRSLCDEITEAMERDFSVFTDPASIAEHEKNSPLYDLPVPFSDPDAMTPASGSVSEPAPGSNTPRAVDEAEREIAHGEALGLTAEEILANLKRRSQHG